MQMQTICIYYSLSSLSKILDIVDGGMSVKTQIDIITGFLGSGKTQFINRLIQTKAIGSEHTVILQCELGQTEIEAIENMQIMQNVKMSHPNTASLLELLKEYTPERLIIESNGINPTAALVDILGSKELRKVSKIHRIFFITNCSSFMVQYRNYSVILNEQIFQCDVAVKMNASGINKNDLSAISAVLTSIKSNRSIYDIQQKRSFDVLVNKHVYLSPPKKRPISEYVIYGFVLLVLLYLNFEFLRMLLPLGIRVPNLQNLVTVFLSILFEAFPFILIGVFVSSILQIFIPSRILESIFLKSKVIGFLAAMFAGVIFPVCDCATVPVAARFIKKGVPVPIAVTFLLSAPIVNPIVILSTLYAFPGYPFIAVYRVITGLLVAILTGIAFQIMPSIGKTKITAAIEVSNCDCGMCSGNTAAQSGVFNKLEAVFKHAANEFFSVSVYLIIGALLSSLIQVYLPRGVLTSLGGNAALSLLSMMLAAFFLSICSTSDAFVARAFANSIPISAVMGFMVLGPMLDLKNLMLLTGNFRKEFVIRFVVTVSVIAFLVLYFVTRLLFGWWS